MLHQITFFTLAMFPFLTLLTNGFKCKNRVCYYDFVFSAGRGGMSFNPRDINPFHCTHIVYCCVNIYNDSVRLANMDAEESNVFVIREQRYFNTQLKTLFAVTFSCVHVKYLLRSKEAQDVFFIKLVSFILRYGFNGLEIQYEQTCSNLSEGKQILITLVWEMYNKFHEEHVLNDQPLLLIALKASAKRSVIDEAYDVENLTSYVDMINLETDDFASGYEDTVGHFSPLYGDYRLDVDVACVDYAVRYWISKGAPRDKINVGLGLHGVTYEISRPYMHYIGNRAERPGHPGPATQLAGYLAYFEVCQYLRWEPAVYRARDQEVPHMVFGNQWVGYEDEWSLTNKVHYVLENQLGGVAIWAFDSDDFVGDSCNGLSYPLMNAINKACENFTS